MRVQRASRGSRWEYTTDLSVFIGVFRAAVLFAVPYTEAANQWYKEQYQVQAITVRIRCDSVRKGKSSYQEGIVVDYGSPISVSPPWPAVILNLKMRAFRPTFIHNRNSKSLSKWLNLLRKPMKVHGKLQ